MKKLLIIVLGAFLIFSCDDEELTDYRAANKQAIEDYLAENNLSATSTESGLYYIVETEGENPKIEEENVADLIYRGYYLDGTEFISEDEPVSLQIADLPIGMIEGLSHIGEGGETTLFLPAHLAYGNQYPSENDVIVFDFQAINVYSDIELKNKEQIEMYLEENNLEAESTQSGVYYIIEEEGNDEFPNSSSSVTLHYKGYDLGGEVFDETTNQPATFQLGGLIAGFQEGLTKFSEGAKGKLFIPSQLAYGPDEPSFNSPIIFDIELISVN